jgi:AraC-like DNA-binding protein
MNSMKMQINQNFMSIRTLSQTVEPASGADILTDVLRQAGIRKRMIDASPLHETGRIEFPCDRSMGLHVVLRGPVMLEHKVNSKRTSVLLRTGDIALMARGEHHALCLAKKASAAQEPMSPGVISGAYQFWHPPLHSFFSEMPAWFILKSEDTLSFEHLHLSIGLLKHELNGTSPGSELVTHGLLDVVFTHLLRAVMQDVDRQGFGLGLAIGDPKMRKALEQLHADISLPWTLESLARASGLSRTALAQRFKSRLGTSALSYLRQLRIQRAMLLLDETTHGLDRIAQMVGFSDAFTFSKVFKRLVGVSPRAFRLMDKEQR